MYLPPDCEAINDERWDTLNDLLPAYPNVVRARYVAYRTFQPLDTEGDATADGYGTLRLREASGQHRLLARGRFPSGHRSELVKARLTPLGRRLASRRRGVKTKVALIHNVPAGEDEGRPYGYAVQLRWIIRLKVPS